MSRSGYIDDLDDPLELGRWRGRVASAVRGKRGQRLLRDLLDALDAMPEKRLVADVLEVSADADEKHAQAWVKLFNDPERRAKHMAAVEKYERVLPQAEENGFSYREFSSTEGTRRKPMPGGKSMLLKLDWLMARGMECVDHGTVSTETKDCTWAEPGSALAKFTGPELSDHNACWADSRFAK